MRQYSFISSVQIEITYWMILFSTSIWFHIAPNRKTLFVKVIQRGVCWCVEQRRRRQKPQNLFTWSLFLRLPRCELFSMSYSSDSIVLLGGGQARVCENSDKEIDSWRLQEWRECPQMTNGLPFMITINCTIPGTVSFWKELGKVRDCKMGAFTRTDKHLWYHNII